MPATLRRPCPRDSYRNAGTYCFGAYYSGDSEYLNSNDTTTDECFHVGLAPSITSFTPKSAKPDATVTIKGKNLSGATEVTVGGSSSHPHRYGHQIKFKLPSGAKSGKRSTLLRNRDRNQLEQVKSHLKLKF